MPSTSKATTKPPPKPTPHRQTAKISMGKVATRHARKANDTITCAASATWNSGNQASSAKAADLWQVFPRPLLEVPQHIAFASGAVDAATIAVINSAITELQPRVQAMRDAEARPILLRYTIAAQPWFAWFEVIGLIAFALSGVLLAKGNGWSLFGAFVLAALPALGGGVLRDLLVGRQPLYVLEGPLPLLIVAGVVVGS